MTKWLTATWWRYILDDSHSDRGYGTRLSRFWCRVTGHPCGVWFYNVGGSQPDYRCKGCGMEIA